MTIRSRPHPASQRAPGAPRWVAVLFLLVGGVLLAAPDPARAGGSGTDGGERPTVLVAQLDDAVTPITADHLADALDAAESDGHAALVLEIDTPGGLVASMRDIVQDFLDAEVPVVAYVTPEGARAASAGALIAWSAHVVAMAPATTIGAATPVDLEGGEVGDKVVEDAAAYARAVAEERGRNIDLAEAAVVDGRAFSATEALDQNLADVIAGDREEMLAAVDGTEVQLGDGSTAVIDSADAEVHDFDMSVLRSILQFLADPNLAFILLSLGTLGIIYELANPGEWIAGGLGVALVLLSLVSIAVLPVEVAGFLFLALAIALFVAELFAPGVGVAAVLGSIALVLAGVFMFREDAPGVSLSLAAVIPTAAVIALGVVIAGRLALRARHSTPVTGMEHLLGQEVVVEQSSGTTGQAQLEGSWWRVTGDEPLAAGERVRVVAIDGIELAVEPVEKQATRDGEDQP